MSKKDLIPVDTTTDESPSLVQKGITLDQVKLFNVIDNIQTKTHKLKMIRDLYEEYDKYVFVFGYSCSIRIQGTEIPPEHKLTLEEIEQTLKYLVPTLPELGIEKELINYFAMFRTGKFKSKEKKYLKLRRCISTKLERCVNKINHLPFFKKITLNYADHYDEFNSFIDKNIESVKRLYKLRNNLQKLLKKGQDE